MLKKFYQKHAGAFERFDGLLLNNTVLERGLVIAPIIFLANSMQNALVLGLGFVLITFFTLLIASFVPKALPYTIRVILYVVISSLLFIPAAMLLEMIFTQAAVRSVGVFLPLLTTNSLIVTKSETRFLKKKRLAMLLDVINHCLGFFVVIVLIGFIRELLGTGSIMGYNLDVPILFNVAMLPFGGFIIMGFLAAALQKLRLHVTSEEPTKRWYGKRRRRRRNHRI